MSVILGEVHSIASTRRSEGTLQELVLSYRVGHGVELGSSGLAAVVFTCHLLALEDTFQLESPLWDVCMYVCV